MRRLFAFFALVLATAFSLLAQTTAPQPQLTPQQKAEAMKKAQEKFSRMSKEEILENARRFKSRVPAKKNSELRIQNPSTESIKHDNQSQSTQELMPLTFSIPGEFEESQGVLLSWSYYAFDKNGNQLDPFTKDFGFRYTSQTEYDVEPIAGWLLDTLENSPFGPVWAKLANAIQQEVPVWLVVYKDEDTTTLKNYMQAQGMPLTSYRFFNVGGGNAFWMRDFGPVGLYYGDQDSVGFLDLTYYPGRAADDSIPEILGKKLGYKVFTTQLQAEGGNFMTDGWGNSFTSTMTNTNNNHNYGQGYVKWDSTKSIWVDEYSSKASWTTKRTLDTMKYVFGSSRVTVLPTLQCDGGTGHIDMYTKLFDDATIINTVYPEVFNKTSFKDYKIAKGNLDTIRALKTVYNTPYRVFTMPVPTGDKGRYDSTTCTLFGADPRGFLNGLTINKTFLFPSFSSDGSGNEAQTEEAKRLFEKYLPGYKVVPFDSRLLTPMAGALHCITMQIPAENPVRFKHAAIRGNVATQASYPLSAIISNRSGIAEAKVMWRIKGTSTWTSSLMSNLGGSYAASLPSNVNATSETIEYYLEARSNAAENAKTMRYPITAPEGYFSFTYGSTVSVADENIYGAELQEPYPNPAQNNVSVPFSLAVGGNTEFSLFDATGREVMALTPGLLPEGTYSQRVPLNGLSAGVYALSMRVNGVNIAMKKIVVY